MPLHIADLPDHQLVLLHWDYSLPSHVISKSLVTMMYSSIATVKVTERVKVTETVTAVLAMMLAFRNSS